MRVDVKVRVITDEAISSAQVQEQVQTARFTDTNQLSEKWPGLNYQRSPGQCGFSGYAYLKCALCFAIYMFNTP